MKLSEYDVVWYLECAAALPGLGRGRSVRFVLCLPRAAVSLSPRYPCSLLFSLRAETPSLWTNTFRKTSAPPQNHFYHRPRQYTVTKGLKKARATHKHSSVKLAVNMPLKWKLWHELMVMFPRFRLFPILRLLTIIRLLWSLQLICIWHGPSVADSYRALTNLSGQTSPGSILQTRVSFQHFSFVTVNWLDSHMIVTSIKVRRSRVKYRYLNSEL